MELPSGAKVGTQYRVLERIARTSFSVIYLGVNEVSDEKLAIKIESKANKHSKLKHEAEVYRSLTGGIGIPFIRWFGKEGDCNAMVFDFLGTPLEELFDFCNRKFTLKTVLLLADQLISRIEYVHTKSFLHRHISPKNLLTGTDKSGNQVHVIGFHSAKEYRDPQSHAHIACCENQRPIGDPAYASISTHLGLEQSRRDDIESLGYVMLYFCRGSLPWQEHNAHKGEQLWNWVKEKKSSTSIEDLCFGLPPEFTDYLHYARSLDFDQEPDYAYLRGLFRAIFSREGFQYDYVFDWTWHEQQSTAHADCQAPSESATCNDDKIGCDSTDSMEASVTLAPQCAFAVENPGPMVYPTRALEAQGNGMVSELNMRPVSQEVHEDEVNTILQHITYVEENCRLLQPPSRTTNELSDKQWQAFGDLHRLLLFQYHDVLLATQHPLAPSKLRHLPADSGYDIPTRMWNYGIFSFLEKLRHHLPHSREHLLRFLHLAYRTLGLLFEMVPSYREIWTRFLRDLALYRVSIEPAGTRDSEEWSSTASGWR